MSIHYRLHQNKSVGTNLSGKWYARMVPMGTTHTRELAELIQRNCTVKKADVLAVLEELVETMRDQMQLGQRVKLDGFGSFKIGLQCKGAATSDDFCVSKNVTGLRVVFSPERTSDTSGNRSKQFLQGVKVEELPVNMIEKKKSSPTPSPSQSLTPNPSPAGEGDQGGGGSNPSPAPSTGGGDNGDQPDMD